MIKMKNDKYIESFELENNVTIKTYNLNPVLIYEIGRTNAFASFPNRRMFFKKCFLNKDCSKEHVIICISKKLLENMPQDVLKMLLWHEIGHLRGKGKRSEIFADIYAIKNSGFTSEEYWLLKYRLISYIKFGTFDLNDLLSIDKINMKTRLKLHFGLKSISEYV